MPSALALPARDHVDAQPVPPLDPSTFETLPYDIHAPEYVPSTSNEAEEAVEIGSESEEDFGSGHQVSDLDARIAYLQQLGIKDEGPGVARLFEN